MLKIKNSKTLSLIVLVTLCFSCNAQKSTFSDNKPKIDNMEDKLILVLRFETKEGKMEAFKNELHPLLEKLSKRPNFVSVTFHKDIDNPRAIVLYEVWEKESKKGFMQKNLADPDFRTYQDNVKELLSKPPVVFFLEAYKEL